MSKTSRAITKTQAGVIIAIVVIAIIGAAYYGTTTTTPPTPTGTTTAATSSSTASLVQKIAIVTDTGGRGDLAFNDMAFKGADQASKDFGLQVAPLISKTESDYIPNLETAANDPQVILIVGVGFLLTDAINATARKYPDKNFAIIDGFVPGLPNVMSILFQEHKSSAIVGAIAALAASYYNYSKVGMVLGIEIPTLWKFEIGYKWGVDWALKWYQNKFGKPAPVIGATPVKNRVLWTYTGSFSDPTKGYEAAKAMYGQGAFTCYNVAGLTGLGLNTAVQEIATEKSLTMGPPFWIGVDADQDWLNPGFILVSAMKRVDTGVYLAAQLVLQGKFRQVVAENGGVVTLGIGTSVAGSPVQGVSVSTLSDLGEFIQMGIDAQNMTGKQVLPMPPAQIEAKVAAMRNAIPSWVWDAAKELQDGITNGTITVPLAQTQADVDSWRAQLG
jgi:basic membrane protein A